MATPLLSDEVWDQIRTLLPERAPRLLGGRPPIGDREALTGVLFVLKTRIRWQDLPKEMGCGCGMTCLRRLRQWRQTGAWPRIQELLQLHLRDVDRYDWSRAGEADRANAFTSNVSCGAGELQEVGERAELAYPE